MHRSIASAISCTFAAVCFCGLLGSCSSGLTAEESAYLQRAMDHPTIFTQLKSEESTLWSRAASWLMTYSEQPIVEANAEVIRTAAAGSGRDFELSFGYEVRKRDAGEELVEIHVSCSVSNMFYGERAKRNARLLAYYIATGDVPSPRLMQD